MTEPTAGRPKYGRALLGLATMLIGIVVIVFALLLPLGFLVAESDDTSRLLVAIAVLLVVGAVLIGAGREILRP